MTDRPNQLWLRHVGTKRKMTVSHSSHIAERQVVMLGCHCTMLTGQLVHCQSRSWGRCSSRDRSF